MSLRLHEFETKVKLNHGIKRLESDGLTVIDYGVYTVRKISRILKDDKPYLTDVVVYYVWTKKTAELSTLENKE